MTSGEYSRWELAIIASTQQSGRGGAARWSLALLALLLAGAIVAFVATVDMTTALIMSAVYFLCLAGQFVVSARRYRRLVAKLAWQRDASGGLRLREPGEASA